MAARLSRSYRALWAIGRVLSAPGKAECSRTISSCSRASLPSGCMEQLRTWGLCDTACVLASSRHIPTSLFSSGAAEELGDDMRASDAGADGREDDEACPDEGWAVGDLTPTKVVQELDRHIVGQADAKRAVAVALRNRWRRHRVASPLKEEIVPKNMLMIGPTGCGKTEVARRLAKLADAPFVKVEATKFTEVGFHGRDVDQIIRDLVENAIVLQRHKARARLLKAVKKSVEDKLLDVLCGPDANAAEMRELLRAGELDDRVAEVDLPDNRFRAPLDPNSGQLQMTDFFIRLERAIHRPKAERRSMTVAEARAVLQEVELEKNLDSDMILKEAIQSAESDGIVFIDEIDKIVTSSELLRSGADASQEGVQRDLLPIIEGSLVSTKYGNINTEHILFICSGAFHSCKPSDMLAELQGRLPIRVELKGLSRQDLYRILTEPEYNMIQQQMELLKTEGVQLEFTDNAIRELAAVAAEVNRTLDNIGARRLHTVLERVVEDISFHAPEKAGQRIVIDKEVPWEGHQAYLQLCISPTRRRECHHAWPVIVTASENDIPKSLSMADCLGERRQLLHTYNNEAVFSLLEQGGNGDETEEQIISKLAGLCKDLREGHSKPGMQQDKYKLLLMVSESKERKKQVSRHGSQAPYSLVLEYRQFRTITLNQLC